MEVFLVGDLVNKGPYSADVVKFARKSNFHCVRGNHDDRALWYVYNPLDRPEKYNYLDDLSRYVFLPITRTGIKCFASVFMRLNCHIHHCDSMCIHSAELDKGFFVGVVKTSSG
jgi:hypothetical protein